MLGEDGLGEEPVRNVGGNGESDTPVLPPDNSSGGVVAMPTQQDDEEPVPACPPDRHPSPPPELDSSISYPDRVGQTALSKQWVLKTLMELVKTGMGESSDDKTSLDQSLGDPSVEPPSADQTSGDSVARDDELDAEMERRVCELWDLSQDREVALYLDEINAIPILRDVLEGTKICRAQEVALGILGNMACVPSLSSTMTLMPELRETLLTAICESPDSGVLTEGLRLLLACLNQSEAASKPWLEHLMISGRLPNRDSGTTHPSETSVSWTWSQRLCRSARYILTNSRNEQLLAQTAQLVDFVLDSFTDLQVDWCFPDEDLDDEEGEMKETRPSQNQIETKAIETNLENLAENENKSRTLLSTERSLDSSRQVDMSVALCTALQQYGVKGVDEVHIQTVDSLTHALHTFTTDETTLQLALGEAELILDTLDCIVTDIDESQCLEEYKDSIASIYSILTSLAFSQSSPADSLLKLRSHPVFLLVCLDVLELLDEELVAERLGDRLRDNAEGELEAFSSHLAFQFCKDFLTELHALGKQQLMLAKNVLLSQENSSRDVTKSSQTSQHGTSSQVTESTCANLAEQPLDAKDQSTSTLPCDTEQTISSSERLSDVQPGTIVKEKNGEVVKDNCESAKGGSEVPSSSNPTQQISNISTGTPAFTPSVVASTVLASLQLLEDEANEEEDEDSLALRLQIAFERYLDDSETTFAPYSIDPRLFHSLPTQGAPQQLLKGSCSADPIVLSDEDDSSNSEDSEVEIYDSDTSNK